MTISRHHVSFKTYALAFAVVLSPALMQTGVTCHQSGDTTLSTLDFEVDGQNHIPMSYPYDCGRSCPAFDPEDRTYDIGLPVSADTAILRADSNYKRPFSFALYAT